MLSPYAVYPIIYALGFIMLYFVWLYYQLIATHYDEITHILQDYFTGTGAIVIAPVPEQQPQVYGSIWKMPRWSLGMD